jgi:predicted regulator of Ras-like GTPase activity (Roadblock/LC7/MglB family)
VPDTSEVQTAADLSSFTGVLTGFVETRAGVREALAISPDGLLLASSFNEAQGDVEHIAAISAGLGTLTSGAADCFGFAGVRQMVVELDADYLILASLGTGAMLAVVAEQDCDIIRVGYESALLAQQCSAVVSPALIEQLRSALMR